MQSLYFQVFSVKIVIQQSNLNFRQRNLSESKIQEKMEIGKKKTIEINKIFYKNRV